MDRSSFVTTMVYVFIVLSFFLTTNFISREHLNIKDIENYVYGKQRTAEITRSPCLSYLPFAAFSLLVNCFTPELFCTILSYIPIFFFFFFFVEKASTRISRLPFAVKMFKSNVIVKQDFNLVGVFYVVAQCY